MASTPGVEPAPRWWEASALTTAHAPPLIERRLCYDYRFSIPNRDRSESRKTEAYEVGGRAAAAEDQT